MTTKHESLRECTCGCQVSEFAEDDAGRVGYWCVRCNRWRGTDGEHVAKQTKTYLGGYAQALCLCPPERCYGCIRSGINDTKPVRANQCGRDCPVAQALKRSAAKPVVQENIPYTAVGLFENGKQVVGKITGRACEFPHFVHDTVDSHLDVEISWDLAYRLLIGEAAQVRL